jgi:hypothetical protein
LSFDQSEFVNHMTAVFDQLGLRFQYPENWTVEKDATIAERLTVSVYSPEGAFWTVMRHPANTDSVELAEAALVAMQNEYQDLDSEKSRELVGEVELVGFDLNFYCLDLTNTAWIRAGGTGAATYLLICQAEDREFEQVSAVFQAMTASLLSTTG